MPLQSGLGRADSLAASITVLRVLKQISPRSRSFSGVLNDLAGRPSSARFERMEGAVQNAIAVRLQTQLPDFIPRQRTPFC